jgi:hypothetical protein
MVNGAVLARALFLVKWSTAVFSPSKAAPLLAPHASALLMMS